MIDLFGHGTYTATTAATASATPPAKPDLGKMLAAIEEMNAVAELEAGPLRKLFADHGYDLANGDVLYHAPGMAVNVPPRYRAQVQESPLVQPGHIVFTRNPRFSLF